MITLGLDIGPTSIGWALIDESKEAVVASGGRIFPEGVERDKQGGEMSKNANRRTARGQRRQISRRAGRKRDLLRLLDEAGMLPSDGDELNTLLDRNPYELRRRAIDEPLTAHEFGRVLLHLNQRRGFKSNRKTDKARDADTKGMLAEISALQKTMDDTGAQTLGEHVARIEERFDHRSSAENDRTRHRHTRRDMYEREFDILWTTQAADHPKTLTDDLKERVDPIVQQAIVQVRKVVNAVIREFGRPDRIHVELAREAKNSLQRREEIRFENAKQRKRREEAAKAIEEHGDKPTGGKIKRYLLWQEQEKLCPYSQNPISLAQLLSDAVDVDHILPRWRSLDDSMAIRVVCFRDENEAKGDQTPREWLE